MPIVKVHFFPATGSFLWLSGAFWHLQHPFTKSMHKGNAIPSWSDHGKSGRRLCSRPHKHCPSAPKAGTQTHLPKIQEQSYQPGGTLKKKVEYVNFLGLSVPLPGVRKHCGRCIDFCQFSFWQVPTVGEWESQWVFWLLFWVLLHRLCFTTT